MTDLLEIADSLTAKLKPMQFGPPVTHLYNPLDYARAPYATYLDRFGLPPREVVLLGMNPGPWGMMQTGVPFGEISFVRDWMGIEAPVKIPKNQHAKRPILGFSCARSEVSGARLWGWARDTFLTPERFFERFFVMNYCPLVFVEESGKNRTPDKLPAQERDPLIKVCDEALRRTIERLAPRYVIGVGAFAQRRAQEALRGMDVTVGRILHPSPASPAANRGWAKKATEQLRAMGIEVPPVSEPIIQIV